MNFYLILTVSFFQLLGSFIVEYFDQNPISQVIFIYFYFFTSSVPISFFPSIYLYLCQTKINMISEIFATISVRKKSKKAKYIYFVLKP